MGTCFLPIHTFCICYIENKIIYATLEENTSTWRIGVAKENKSYYVEISKLFYNHELYFSKHKARTRAYYELKKHERSTC